MPGPGLYRALFVLRGNLPAGGFCAPHAAWALGRNGELAQRVGFEPTCSFLQTDFESFSSIGACWNLPECRGSYNR